MAPEPVTETAPRAVRPVLLRQEWRNVAFLHWDIDPAVAAPLLPAGTRPDLLDGRTFVGLIALRMQVRAPLGGLSLPWLGSFGQVNVRLYSVDEDGRRGVAFRSLDAGRLLPAAVGRAGGLPYAWAGVHISRDGDRCSYRVHRRAGGASASIELHLGPRLAPGPLERFVTDRWGLHHRVLGRTVFTAVAHPPWQLHTASADEIHPGLLGAAGLPGDLGPPVSVLWSPRVDDVRIGPRAP
jgi:uncharacterized protein YqjF (DUF2071 family)